MPKQVSKGTEDESNSAVQALLACLSEAQVGSGVGVASHPCPSLSDSDCGGDDTSCDELDYYKMVMDDLGFKCVSDTPRDTEKKVQAPKVAKSLENILSADALQNNLTNTLDLASFNFTSSEETKKSSLSKGGARSKLTRSKKYAATKNRELWLFKPVSVRTDTDTGRPTHSTSSTQKSSSLRPIRITFPSLKDKANLNVNNSNNKSGTRTGGQGSPTRTSLQSTLESTCKFTLSNGKTNLRALKTLPLDHPYCASVADLALKDTCEKVLAKWMDYLYLSSDEMYDFEIRNALDFRFNDDASSMVENRDNSAWQFLEDMKPENLCILSDHQHIYPH